jgi:hypothetical protein
MRTAEGGCLCGAVRFTVSAEPLHSDICHCQSCRKAAGSPSVAWVTVRRNDCQFIKGAPRAFHSSAGVTRTFCALCGTPLTYENQTTPDTIDFTTLSLDEPARFPPNREVWLEDKVSWEALDDRLEHHPRGGG